MSDTGASAQRGFVEGSDRRAHPRQQVRSLGYVELDEGNGGIILNASEGGFAVQAVASLVDDVLPSVRFQLAQSRTWVQLKAKIAWTGDSRKTAGLEFLDVSDETRTQIRDWLSNETTPSVFRPETNSVAESSEPVDVSQSDPSQATEPQRLPGAFLAGDQTLAEMTSVPAIHAPFNLRAPAESLRTNAQEEMQALPVASTAPVKGQSLEPTTAAKGDFLTSPDQDELVSNRMLLVVLCITVLILASLAAGWAAGHGTFSWLAGYLQNHTLGELDSAPHSVGHITQISQIEIVDAANQTWTIPFNGPISGIVQMPHSQQSVRPAGSSVPSQIPFQTWVLSAPVRANTSSSNDSPLAAPPSGAENPSNSPLGSAAPSLPMLQQPVPPPQPTSAQLRRGDLIQRVEPVYPSLAREQGISGTVRLRITVGPDGLVRAAELISGPQPLVAAAKTAVLQWRYAPTVLDGRAIQTEKEISIVFQMTHR